MTSLTLLTRNLSQRFLQALEHSALLWEKPWHAAVLALLLYTGLSITTGSPFRLSETPYYNLLADAFLHGQLHLRVVLPNTVDLSFFNDRYYLYWGPLPAVMAMPLVLIGGIQVSDILQTLFLGSMTVGMLAAVLRAATEREVIELSPLQRALLVLTFALGSPFMPITETGNIWQLVTIVGLLFSFLAYWVAFTTDGAKAFFWSGCAVAAVLLTRNAMVFMAIFAAWYLLRRHWGVGKARLLGYCAVGALPVLVALIVTGVYNNARFGSPFDNGVAYHLMNEFFADDFQRYGLLNAHFIPGNLYYTYIFYPFTWAPAFDVRNKTGSLFLLTPVFFLALYALWQDRKRWDTWVLFLSILLANIPILLLMGPGSGNFGPRYALDFAMPLLLLTAFGMKRIPNGFVALLLVISIFHYLVGGLVYIHTVAG